MLRSLVFGAWHPGMPHGDTQLTPADVTDVLLTGVALPPAVPPVSAPTNSEDR